MTDTKKGINVLQRAFQLIESLSGDPRGKGILQLAEETKLPPSTAHRILQTLSQAGYVRQDVSNGIYRLTGKMLDIGSRAVVGRDLREEALPHLRQLRELTGESSHLVVLEGDYALTVESVLSSQRNLVDSRIGERQALHSTAVGKCLMAYLSAEQREKLLARLELTRFTEHTISTVSNLRNDLARIAKQGYALDWEENEIGIRCIAAPVRNASGDTVATVGISGPAARITSERRQDIARAVMDAARAISQATGCGRECSC